MRAISEAWLGALNTLMLAYAVAIIPLAMIYYFSLHHGRMNLTFALIQIFLMLCWTVTGLLRLEKPQKVEMYEESLEIHVCTMNLLQKRRPVLLILLKAWVFRSVHLLLSHFCDIFWPRYLLTALIYMAAVAAIDPDLIVDALIPLATVLAYVMVVFSRLKACRSA